MAGYWVADWTGATRCRPYDYESAYSISTRDDYKRCVCANFGDGEADCPDEDGSGSDDEDSPDIFFEELEEIRANPHYPDDSLSRTLYQVDREVDFIERKMLEMYTALLEAGVIQ